LADPRRRRVVRFLRSADGQESSVEALIDRLGTRGEPPDDRETVAIDLRHAVLPKLLESGLIEYDERRDAVGYRGDPVLERILDVATDELES
jgi:hypothetical protein